MFEEESKNGFVLCDIILIKSRWVSKVKTRKFFVQKTFKIYIDRKKKLKI